MQSWSGPPNSLTTTRRIEIPFFIRHRQGPSHPRPQRVEPAMDGLPPSLSEPPSAALGSICTAGRSVALSAACANEIERRPLLRRAILLVSDFLHPINIFAIDHAGNGDMEHAVR